MKKNDKNPQSTKNTPVRTAVKAGQMAPPPKLPR